jgi:hypothetical protein
MRRVAARIVCACLVVLAAAHASADGQESVPSDLLERIGRYVEDYYARTRTIVGRETVRLQPLDASLRPTNDSRSLEYELRIEWDGAGETPTPPSMNRELTRKSGRLGSSFESPDCFDPHASSIDPLAILLADNRAEFTFTMKGLRDGGRVAMIDYRPVERGTPAVTWKGECATIDLNGNIEGRIWADVATGTVLRIEERLTKPFQILLPENALSSRLPLSQTFDRLETGIRYEPVTFRDPDETLMLPKWIRTLQVVYNGGVPRLLTLQSYDRYRRFMTGARVIK